jgi:3-deoxy-D-manno-octulosonic-acid transferase
LSQFFYQLFCWTYPLLLRLAAPFHPKARAWVKGRRGIFDRLEALRGKGPWVWVHCASLGEFEQGRPIMESIRKNYPAYRILLTFFSPSGYEHQKHFAGADHVEYLPMDGPRNAKRFLEIVEPRLVIFVKYEFWFFYLKKIFYRNIPLLLVSAYFRPTMSFFKWYGQLSRKMLTRFHHIFVQDELSKNLLAQIGIEQNVEIGGDTRFDRVKALAQLPATETIVGRLLTHRKAIVVGSSWPADEALWLAVLPWLQTQGLSLVLVPHEVDSNHLQSMQKQFPSAVRYTEILAGKNWDTEVLMIDRIGLLAELYRYGWVNYVGGGLTSGGVHNVLEAAVYARPVITGPRIEKYREAVELARANGSYTLPAEKTSEQLQRQLEAWLGDPMQADAVGERAGRYVQARTGAADRVLRYIQENRLLTN